MMLTLIVRMHFHKIIATTNYKNIFTTKSSRFTVLYFVYASSQVYLGTVLKLTLWVSLDLVEHSFQETLRNQ